MRARPSSRPNDIKALDSAGSNDAMSIGGFGRQRIRNEGADFFPAC